MKKSGGLITNAIKMFKDPESMAVTTPVKANLKSSGKAAPVSKIKPKQKSMPVASKKLGNHF